ncbi:MAG: type II secretion system F family protein [Alphaproteobacteria bacterium]|nr:type II secretion system F family protein [Alphaproteobacteria bacterium]
MPLYAYKAVTSHGTHQSGYRFALSINDIYTSLKGEGLLLTDCQVSNEERFLPRITNKFSKRIFTSIPQSQLIDFCHHMAQLDDAGVPIDIALQDLASSTSHQKFRGLLYSIHHDVNVGIPLSESLARHPDIFDRVFQKLINTAEQTGSYAPQFRHLESHLRHHEIMQHQIYKAIRAPLILSGLMTILILVIIDFVIPGMTTLLTSLGLNELPLSTRLLLQIAPVLAYFPLLLLLMGISLGIGYLNPSLRYYLSWAALRIPLYKRLALNQFWHVFGVMIGAGIDLIPSFAQAIQVVRNPYLRDHLTTLSGEIKAGAGLSEIFSGEETLVSPLMIRFLKLSEQTGHLRQLIPQAAGHYQNQTFRQIEALVSWLEPSLIIITGSLMLWVIVSVIVPFYETIGTLS